MTENLLDQPQPLPQSEAQTVPLPNPQQAPQLVAQPYIPQSTPQYVNQPQQQPFAQPYDQLNNPINLAEFKAKFNCVKVLAWVIFGFHFFSLFSANIYIFISISFTLAAALLLHFSVQNINSGMYIISIVLYGLDLIFYLYLFFVVVVAGILLKGSNSVPEAYSEMAGATIIFLFVYLLIIIIPEVIEFIILLVHYKEFGKIRTPLQPIIPPEA